MLKLMAGQLAIFLALLLALDLALWMTFPIDDSGHSQRKISQNLKGLKTEIIYTTVGGGLRSASMRTVAKPKHSLRLLCLGASTTDQSTQETQDTWCAILEKKLRSNYADRQLNFHALSFGRGGDRAINTARWLWIQFDKIQPDIVITLLGINDLTWNGGPGYKTRRVEDVLGSFETQALKKLCVDVSQFCRRVKRAWKAFVNRQNLSKGRVVEWHSRNLPHLTRRYRELPYVSDPVRNPDPLDEFQASVSWILEFLQRRDVAVIVLGQPVLWKSKFTPDEFNSLWFRLNTSEGPIRPPGSWLLREMRKYNHTQRKIAYKFGFKYIDLDAGIPKSLEYYFDDAHFTDKGSAQIAEIILPILRKVVDQR